MNEKIKELLGIRSPSLEMMGYYLCENCDYHADCICEEGEMVVCTRSHKHVQKTYTCEHFKRKNISKPDEKEE